MNKSDLVAAIAEKQGLPNSKANAVINELIELIAMELAKGGKVTITGFGAFSTTVRNARSGRNPRTGKEIAIPAQISPKFSAGSSLKSAVNKT